jgi:hypothetical protein
VKSFAAGTVAKSRSAAMRWRKRTLSSHGFPATCAWSQRTPHCCCASASRSRSFSARRCPDVSRRRSASWGSPAEALYDPLVALAAVEHDADLATRDLRAKATYEVVGARVIVAR